MSATPMASAQARPTHAVRITCNGGAKRYPENHWRMAVSDFVRMRQAGQLPGVPALEIAGVRLMLYSSDMYDVGGSACDTEGWPRDTIQPASIIMVENSRKADVEVALMEFVLNNRRNLLAIDFGGRILRLWKFNDLRGAYGIQLDPPKR